MKRISIAAIKRVAPTKPEGYEEAVMSAGVVEGDYVFLADEAYEKLSGGYFEKPKTYGAGTEVKALLSKIGITSSPTCSCNARVEIMNKNGIAWCEENVETICDWLQEEATKRKLPFVRLAGKALIHMAIRRAKKGTNK